MLTTLRILIPNLQPYYISDFKKQTSRKHFLVFHDGKKEKIELKSYLQIYENKDLLYLKFSNNNKNIMVGLLQRNDLLNYLIILGKLTIWECRKNNTSLIFRLFLHKVEVKKQVEKIIAIRNRKLRDFQIRWE